MKKIFKIIGLISLTCFSFFITEKTSLVVKNMDDIMISIKANCDNFKTNSVDAIIKDNTIIPGISGKKVNINKILADYKSLPENNLFLFNLLKITTFAIVINYQI